MELPTMPNSRKTKVCLSRSPAKSFKESFEARSIQECRVKEWIIVPLVGKALAE
jgi:hypothetical protein